MANRNRLTNNSDETDIASLISGDNVFSIPYFQRAYKWKRQRLDQLNEDILNVVDTSDLHFLGAIIVHGRRSNPSDPDVFEVIDGQQRITTIFLYLCAAIRTLCDLEEFSEASSLFLKYLVIGRETNLISNVKLHPCKEDRTQLNLVFSDVLRSKPLTEKLGSFKPKLLPPSGKDSGTLRSNYNLALRFLEYQHKQEGAERIRSICRALLDCMSVVQIDVSDPTNGPKIFDSLNSRQEPMTVGDLVRNDIFSRVADEKNADYTEQIDQHSWQPFYRKFQEHGKNLFESYFFPYGLIHNPNLRKSEVYNHFRKEWRETDDPTKIVEALTVYQNAFIDIACGKTFQNHTKDVAMALRRLWRLRAPTSTYPFLMRLSRALEDKVVPEKEGIETLEVIESFLVRRAVCGHEPTGLHAVFKRLWTDCNGKPDANSVTREVAKHRTVVWPNNDAFAEAVRTRPLYGVAVTKYLIVEYDRSLGGDQPDEVPWIEHILPENPSKEWFGVFTKEQHHSLKDVLGNLVPLSQAMNVDLSNKPYEEKSRRYVTDSMFKSARVLSDTHEKWSPETIADRGNELASWAVKRWPF